MKVVDRMIKLKERCLACWAKEYSDIFPQHQNSIVATEELKRNGYPDCTCKGKSRLEFNYNDAARSGE
jgi:hypothetical protein